MRVKTSLKIAGLILSLRQYRSPLAFQVEFGVSEDLLVTIERFGWVAGRWHDIIHRVGLELVTEQIVLHFKGGRLCLVIVSSKAESGLNGNRRVRF